MTTAIAPVTIELYPEQKELINAIYAAIKQRKPNRILAVAPCGFGKTLITAKIAYDSTIRRDNNLLFIVPFVSLIPQAVKEFARFQIWAGVIAGGYKEHRTKRVQVATIQTLRGGRDISWFVPDIVVADEAHITSFDTWMLRQFPYVRDGIIIDRTAHLHKEIETLGFDFGDYSKTFAEVQNNFKELAKIHHPDHGGDPDRMMAINEAWAMLKKHRHLFSEKPAFENHSRQPWLYIGLTATPFRNSKHQSFGDLFYHQVNGLTPGEMVKLALETNFERGLVPCIYYGVQGANLDRIREVDGDYDQHQLGIAVSDPKVVENAVKGYIQFCENRPFICFAVNHRHVDALSAEFTKAGIVTEVIKATTKPKDREAIYERVSAGKTKGIVSVDCIGTGFDLPLISAIIFCRPTKSLNIWMQGVGRGGRRWLGKKDCIVIDQGGNSYIKSGNRFIKRHGFIEDIVYGDLTQSKDPSPDEAPVKECPSCIALIRSLNMICPCCGYEFPKGEKKTPQADLVLLVPDNKKKYYDHYRRKLKECYLRNVDPTAAAMWTREFYQRDHPRLTGFWVHKAWRKGAVFGDSPTIDDITHYADYLRRCQARTKTTKHQAEWWFDMNMNHEFGEDWKSKIEQLTHA